MSDFTFTCLHAITYWLVVIVIALVSVIAIVIYLLNFYMNMRLAVSTDNRRFELSIEEKITQNPNRVHQGYGF